MRVLTLMALRRFRLTAPVPGLAAPGDPAVDVHTRLAECGANGERPATHERLHGCLFPLGAGHEATAKLIGNGVHALLAKREQCVRLS